VALLPPLVASGLLAGAGHGTLALGAMLLFLSNVAGVNLAAMVTFVLQGIRPRTWWETEKAKRATRIALVFWVVLLGVFVAIVFVLRK
jgi:uncharacterized membrane protein